MAVLKSKAKFTEPFVGKREVIVMLSVQGGQATASATELDYDAVHALEQTIVDLTFVADTPQTETHDLRTDTHECVSDTPQTETSKTIPLNEWLSFKEYVLEMDGEGGLRIFRIIPMSEYKLQNQELHTDCGWGEPNE